MEAVKIKGIAQNGILSVPVPKEFEDKELEVIILFNDKASIDDEVTAHEKKVERLLRIVGAAKFPDTPLTKYDVYHQ
ncbi:MAG TPA: hypothetical protein VF610_06900 [Segetibacter sp.]|jgi:hypothetical protein